MSVYTDKMQDFLAGHSVSAIRQLESDDLEGNLEATYLLGKVYYDSIFCPSNAKKAIQLWEKGAQNGNPNCLRSLGDCYFYGFGYDKNYDIAIKIYNEILKKNSNDHQSICQIGRMNGLGLGVPQNITHSITILKEAWKKGSGRAATEIGLLYMFDMEKTVDNVKEAIK